MPGFYEAAAVITDTRTGANEPTAHRLLRADDGGWTFWGAKGCVEAWNGGAARVRGCGPFVEAMLCIQIRF
jgi:hypothetical protein